MQQASKRNVLFAVEGPQEPELTESFKGVLLAPHATVHLPSVDVLQGAFFANELIVHQATEYEHYPFARDDCATACGLMFGCDGEPAVKSCPGASGGSCTKTADCADGLTCGVDNGAYYGRSRADDVCWDATICESSLADSNCGGIDAPCGLCEFPVLAVSCVADSECPGGDLCGSNNGERFQSSEPNVCEPSFCADSASLIDGSCGTPWSPSGLCECTPNCDQKTCGDNPADGCGGQCLGLCAGGEEGCTGNVDCNFGEMCVPTLDGSSTRCLVDECALTDPLSVECDDGFNACGEPCACDELCQETRDEGVTWDGIDGVDLPQEVGELTGSLGVSPSGASSYSIPLKLPPGRAGLSPSLSLDYNARAGDGPLGPHWQLNGFSQIYRCPKSFATDGHAEPIDFNGVASAGLCLDGERLIHISGTENPTHDAYWRTEKESFKRITSFGSTIHHFEVETKDGLVYHYGSTDNSSVFGPTEPDTSHIGGSGTTYHKRVWALERVEDRNNNWISYEYRTREHRSEPGHPKDSMVPASITYSPGDRQVLFRYQERGVGTASSLPRTRKYIAGERTRSLDLLRAIDVVAPASPVRRYRLDYSEPEAGASPNQVMRWSQLNAIYECAATTTGESCKRPVRFEYVQPATESVQNLPTPSFPDDQTQVNGRSLIVLDINGDGADDVVVPEGSDLFLGSGDSSGFSNAQTLDGLLVNAPTRQKYQCFGAQGVIDFDGDGDEELVDTCGRVEDGVWTTDVFDFEGAPPDGEGLTLIGHISVNVLGALDVRGPVARFADINGDSLPDVILAKSYPSSGGVSVSSVYLGTEHDGSTLTMMWYWGLDGASLPETELFDVDGDGLPNVVRHLHDCGEGEPGEPKSCPWEFLKLGDEHTVPEWIATNIQGVDDNDGQEVSLEDVSFKFGDWNGDGLVDVLSAKEDDVIAWFSKGDGQFVPRRQPWPLEGDANKALEGTVVVSTPLGSELRRGVSRIYFEADEMRIYDHPQNPLFFQPFAYSITGDFNGDGSPDLLFPDGGLVFTNASAEGLLEAVETGYGRRTEIAHGEFESFHYSTSQFSSPESANCSGGLQGEYTCQRGQLPMVSRVKNFERGNSGQLRSLGHTDYKYTNIRVGRGGRGSYGPETREIKNYDPSGEFVNSTLENYNNRDWVRAGTLAQVVVTSAPLEARPGELSYLTEDETVYFWKTEESSVGRPYAFLEVRTEESRVYLTQSPNEAHDLTSWHTRFEYDEYGNLEMSRRTTWGVTNDNIDRLTTIHEYEHASNDEFVDNWILDRRSMTRVNHSKGSGDMADSTTREVTRQYNPTTGLLERTKREGNEDEALATVVQHDAYGNLTEVIKINILDIARTSRRFFDSRGMFPITFQNEMGHVTEARFEELTGALSFYVDENGLETHLSYDNFGRPIGKTDWMESTFIDYQEVDDGWDGNQLVSVSEWAKVRVSRGRAGGEREDSDYDAYQRPVMQRAKGYSDQWVTSTTEYDWRGNPVRKSRPHAQASTAPGVLFFEYDNWGRLTEEIFADSTRYFHGYIPRIEGHEADLFQNPNAIFAKWVSPRTVFNEGDRETVEVFDHHGSLVTTFDALGTSSSFEYGPFEQVSKMVHVVPSAGSEPSVGNTTTTEYDDWGRVLKLDDPDLGVQEYKYDAFDQLQRVTDDRGLVTDFYYDDLSRVIARVDNWPSDEPELTTWVYDTAEGGLGRLHYTTSPDQIVERFSYFASDEAHPGLTKGASLEVEGEAFATTFDYDEHNRPWKIHYPDVGSKAFEVQNDYDDYGHLVGVNAVHDGAAAKSIWSFEEAHEGHLVKDARFGTNTLRSTSFQPWTTRVEGIAAAKSGGELVQELTYAYTDAGDVLSRHDHLRPSQGEETFVHDALHRLKSRTLVTNGESETEEFEYDLRGNITLKSGVSYLYDEGDKPHAVRSAGDNIYGYDAVGNQNARSGSWVPQGEQSITYNAFNLPRHVITGPQGASEETEFQYGASGTRVLKRSDTHESLLFGGIYERVKDFGSALEETHKYLVYANGEKVAQISTTKVGDMISEPETVYFLGDALGSVSTMVDDEGTVVHSQLFEPFGQSSNAEFSDEGVRYGFTGHAHDALLGLVDMGGRMYDAQLGRFLSADPIVQAPANLQSHNRYSYVWNNPLAMVDPSGFQGVPVGGASGNGGGCGNGCTGGQGAQGGQGSGGSWSYSEGGTTTVVRDDIVGQAYVNGVPANVYVSPDGTFAAFSTSGGEFLDGGQAAAGDTLNIYFNSGGASSSITLNYNVAGNGEGVGGGAAEGAGAGVGNGAAGGTAGVSSPSGTQGVAAGAEGSRPDGSGMGSSGAESRSRGMGSGGGRGGAGSSGAGPSGIGNLASIGSGGSSGGSGGGPGSGAGSSGSKNPLAFMGLISVGWGATGGASWLGGMFGGSGGMFFDFNEIDFGFYAAGTTAPVGLGAGFGWGMEYGRHPDRKAFQGLSMQMEMDSFRGSVMVDTPMNNDFGRKRGFSYSPGAFFGGFIGLGFEYTFAGSVHDVVNSWK